MKYTINANYKAVKSFLVKNGKEFRNYSVVYIDPTVPQMKLY